MLSEQVVREMLVETEADERLYYSVANVVVNAPLALEQVAQKSRADILRKILELPYKKYHGQDDVDPRTENVLELPPSVQVIELPSMLHCDCGRFYVMPYLKGDKKLEWQVKDFIGGGTAVYLHTTLDDAMKRVGECECCEEDEGEPTTTTVLNPTVEEFDLSKAYCPNCGPNHILNNGGISRRDGPARCDACEWEGTNGDLMNVLKELDEE